MTSSARIVQISVSPGGVPKRPVPQALRGEGHPITPWSIGANLAIEGIDWNITASFRDREYSRVSRTRHPGDSRVYARVLREGLLTSGDPVRLLTEDEASALLAAR